MKPRYQMNTNILSDLVRHPQATVAKKIALLGEKNICTSIIVAAELHFGARKRGSKRLKKQLETILSALEITPLEEPADRYYGELRSNLEKQRETIGSNDLLIASHALALE